MTSTHDAIDPGADTRLDPAARPPNPLVLLQAWLAEAEQKGVSAPTSLSLATADGQGRPSNRIVRVEHLDADGLVFTSHTGSRKGRDIAERSQVAGVLFWKETMQQVVVNGHAERLPARRSDEIWTARGIDAQATSAASKQSEVLYDEVALRTDAARRLSEADGDVLPRPQTWAAYRIVPDEVEFWRGRRDRIHHRLRYERTTEAWTTSLLQP